MCLSSENREFLAAVVSRAILTNTRRRIRLAWYQSAGYVLRRQTSVTEIFEFCLSSVFWACTTHAILVLLAAMPMSTLQDMDPAIKPAEHLCTLPWISRVPLTETQSFESHAGCNESCFGRYFCIQGAFIRDIHFNSFLLNFESFLVISEHLTVSETFLHTFCLTVQMISCQTECPST